MTKLKQQAQKLPHTPGCYLFKNTTGAVLYVGKAKDLHNRVLQYFGHDNRPQLPYLLEEATDLDYIVVGSELESLFLENTLIKQYLPPYNIKLRDDKNYAFIKIDYGTPIPQIGYARKIEDQLSLSSRVRTKSESRDPSTSVGMTQTKSNNPNSYKLKPNNYFGPYSSARKIKQTLDLVRKIFPYCANREPGKRPCFYYYLHRCPGICVGAITMEEYLQQLQRIEKFLRGDTASITKELKQYMQKLAQKKMFEQAARLRDQLHALEILQEKQTMLFSRKVSWDIVSTFQEFGETCVNLFKVRDGKLIDKENFIYTEARIPSAVVRSFMSLSTVEPIHRHTAAKDDSSPILQAFLENYYADTSDIPKEIYIETAIRNTELVQTLLRSRTNTKIAIHTPVKGEKLKLITLGKTNAQEYLHKWQASQATNTDVLHKALEELQRILQLPTFPRRIEGYDMSNTQGTNPVGSMVVTKDGLPAKSEYRKFKIRVKDTPDDFAMMNETIRRRLEHLPQNVIPAEAGIQNHGLDSGTRMHLAGMTEKAIWERPDLIVIDGGKGQLNAAIDAQTTFLQTTNYPLQPIPMIGLAKRIEEIFLPNNPVPIVLSHDNPTLQILQRLRDEAHRFGITFHRSLRSKQATRSALDTIPGIGPKTKKLLKQKFGTLAHIKNASTQEIADVIGQAKAEVVKKYL